MSILERIEKHYPHMVALREELHRHPELEFDLPRTQALIKKELETLGLEVHTGFATSGLVGILRGGKPGANVMLRADMDALPVQEAADVPYASQEPGCMHACAHDGHMAALLGAAAALTEMRDDIPGNIMFLFQPAEETKFGGAEVMVKDGVMDLLPIGAAFSGHLWGSTPKGKICVKKGCTMASRDDYRLRITGRGGHGAMPNQTIDPVVVAAQIINALQTLVSRYTDPNEPAVVSVCQFNTPPGAPNIIPDYVDMAGTIRAYDDEVRAMLLRRMEQTVKGVCAVHDATYHLEYVGGCAEIRNDPAMAELALASAVAVVGAENAQMIDKPMAASEDFSVFSKLVPSCYVFVGINEGQCSAHHNPGFHWESDCMKPLAGFLAQAALDYLNKK